MMAAQQYQVLQAGVATIGPVLDVVTIDEMGIGAAGEAATVVSEAQRPADGGRNGPGFTADGQRFAVFILGQLDEGAVAGNAAGCFRGNMWAVVEAGNLWVGGGIG